MFLNPLLFQAASENDWRYSGQMCFFFFCLSLDGQWERDKPDCMLSLRLEMEEQEEVGEWKWSAEHQAANSPKSSPSDKETSGFW